MTDDFPPPLPLDYECPAGTVPGWLNGDGLPTSCVGDDPLVEPRPEPTPAVTLMPPIAEVPHEGEIGTAVDVYPVRELADTGPHNYTDPGMWLAAVLFVTGVALFMAYGRGPRV